MGDWRGAIAFIFLICPWSLASGQGLSVFPDTQAVKISGETYSAVPFDMLERSIGQGVRYSAASPFLGVKVAFVARPGIVLSVVQESNGSAPVINFSARSPAGLSEPLRENIWLTDSVTQPVEFEAAPNNFRRGVAISSIPIIGGAISTLMLLNNQNRANALARLRQIESEIASPLVSSDCFPASRNLGRGASINSACLFVIVGTIVKAPENKNGFAVEVDGPIMFLRYARDFEGPPPTTSEIAGFAAQLAPLRIPTPK